MEQVPMSGAYPDIFDSKPFHTEENDQFKLLYYKKIRSIKARLGGKSLISYPFVMAVLDKDTSNIIYFVTAEQSRYATSCLCAFDNTGEHFNHGDWDASSTQEDFVLQARDKACKVFELPRAQPIRKKWFGIF